MGGSKPRTSSPASVGVVKNYLAVFALVEDGVVCGAADSDDAVDIGEAAFFHLQSFLIVVIILFHGPLVSPENMRIPEGIQRKDE